MHAATPTARYEADGSFYLDHPFEPPQPLTASFLDVLSKNLPIHALDTELVEDVPQTTWVHWRYGQRAEAIARLFWPDLQVSAAANPHYRAHDHARDVRKALAEARKAVVAAEALVRCGATPAPSFGQRAAQLMEGRR